MRIGCFITITKPDERGDIFNECFKMASDCFDVVTVIDGEKTWLKEFRWEVISEHFQKGYDQCDADWVVHLDCDFIFHEKDFKKLREAIERCNDYPALSFWKYQFILPDRYNIKSRLVLAVNKGKFGNRIKFDGGGGADLCQPSLDGKLIEIDQVPEARIPFYNYEKIAKVTYQIMDDCGRMDRAYKRTFGKYQLSPDGSDEKAFDGYIKMLKGRIKKAGEHISIEKHPIYMQDLIRNLTKSQFGYNGFNLLDVNSDYLGDYANV